MNYWTAVEKFGTHGYELLTEQLTIYSERIAMNGGMAYEKKILRMCSYERLNG